eukprot:3754229-Pyramimonas_sp.AAC.1
MLSDPLRPPRTTRRTRWSCLTDRRWWMGMPTSGASYGPRTGPTAEGSTTDLGKDEFTLRHWSESRQIGSGKRPGCSKQVLA